MAFNISEKPIYVLGTGLSHDGSACLLKDGEICFAIEKERVTRNKREGKNDTAAIQYCLNAEGISLEDVSLVVQNANFGFFEYGNDYYYGERLFNDKLKVPVITISHHLAHAYNAVGTMPYQSAAILVMDGCGSLMDECIDLEGAIVPELVPQNLRHLYAEKDSFYIYDNDKLTTIYKDFSPLGFFLKDYPMHPSTTQDSIGGVYGAVSHYIFENMMDAGKLMGLAPYGKPGVYEEKIFNFKDGRVFVNYEWMRQFKKPVRSTETFKKNFQYFADIAYWVQKEVEEAVLYVINSRYSLRNIEALAYTGGTALNAVANARILEESSFKKLHLTPAAGDNGLAVGCAYYGWIEALKKPRIIHSGNTFFGRNYLDIDVEKDITSYICFPENIREEKIIRNLFDILPQCFNSKLNEENPCYNIQFVLSNGRNFSFQANNVFAKVFSGNVEKPDSTLYSDEMTLIRSLVDKEYYINAIYNKKIVEIGSSHILFNFDTNKLSMLMREAINKDATKRVNFYYSDNIIAETAKLLSAGKVVAWFQDRCEFGPRALGHRSILADPSIKSMKDFINLKIKFREDFRPFAPSILREDVSEYFHFNEESPYMLLIAQAKDVCKLKCPGIVHANNSSRIQTVTPEWNEKYYQLIKEFKRITGIPMLLNTSLNKKGMPMVETPIEALSFFYECALDNLVINNYLIYK